MMQKILRYELPLFLYATLIFYFSSLPNIEVEKFFKISDKLLHLLEYGILSFLLLRAFSSGVISGIVSGRTALQVYWIPFLLGSVYGISDEIHQFFVPGREASITDWLADTLGCGLVILLFVLVEKYQKSKSDILENIS